MSRPRPQLSKSRSRLRPGLGSRAQSRSSVSSQPYLPDGPADLILPDGPVNEETAELLHEFIHPHGHGAEETLVEELPAAEAEGEPEDPEDEEIVREWEQRKHLPWWKRPSAYWFLAMVPFSSLTMSATIAPRIEIFTRIACKAHKPEYTSHGPADAGIFLPSAVHSRPHDNFDRLLNGTLEYTPSEGQVSVAYTPADLELYRKEQELCASDPVVQAAVAKLATVTTATMGILGFVTTAWWGSVSDRQGRVFVLRFTVLGLLVQMCNFIFVAHYSQHIPGGYWWLLVSAVVEGLFGGITTAAAATHAYIADCTPPASRSRLFSLQLGLLFCGTAIGPSLGGLLVRFTQDLLSLFYIALFVDVLYAATVWFVIPESLTETEMRVNAERHRRRGEEGKKGWWVVSLLSPLSVFVPVRKEKGKGRDWNLMLVAGAFGLVILNFGGITYKFQYAASTYHWGSEALGYWLSLVGASRAVHLTVLLPILIHLFKPQPPAIQLPTAPDEPLSPSGPAPKPPATPAFDLLVARASLFMDVIAYSLMPLAPTGRAFTALSVFGSFGAGFGPAAQSLALEIYTRQGGRETGRLFGAWSVVQVVASQVIGPALYGVTYMRTVETVPAAIFWVSAAGVLGSFGLLMFIRLPADGAEGDVEEAAERVGVGREATLVDEEEDRGRKAKAKSVVASASDSA
ncbi:MFS general substrate transporter [Heliocybe sulcata]|uniref:MFS general substrate transporter n=1 Tax=Heliocybe sulcata TaxID=5364 RepID=A0A5C3NF26_9AGAM|nr:MFS general substrate transporter [Heliocybe sulcata]